MYAFEGHLLRNAVFTVLQAECEAALRDARREASVKLL